MAKERSAERIRMPFCISAVNSSTSFQTLIAEYVDIRFFGNRSIIWQFGLKLFTNIDPFCGGISFQVIRIHQIPGGDIIGE
jgi:hypothetical protein